MITTTIAWKQKEKLQPTFWQARDFVLGFIEFGLSLWPTIYLKSRKVTILRFVKCFLKFTSKEMHYFYRFSYHPFINPIVNPADILPVRGIPRLVIANEEAVAVA